MRSLEVIKVANDGFSKELKWANSHVTCRKAIPSVNSKISGEGPEVRVVVGHLRPMKNKVKHHGTTPVEDSLGVPLGEDLMMRTSARVSSVSLMLKLTVANPEF